MGGVWVGSVRLGGVWVSGVLWWPSGTAKGALAQRRLACGTVSAGRAHEKAWWGGHAAKALWVGPGGRRLVPLQLRG